MIMEAAMGRQPLTEGFIFLLLWASSILTQVIKGSMTLIMGSMTLIKGSMTPLCRLPGDIVVHRRNFSFYFPVAFSIIISIVCSLIFWLTGRGEK